MLNIVDNYCLRTI